MEKQKVQAEKEPKKPGKKKKEKRARRHFMPFWVIPLSFFLIEVFAFLFLSNKGEEGRSLSFWPLAFGALWAALLWGFVRALPEKASRVAFGVVYFLAFLYGAVQTGYYILFREMMWVSGFRYASEGAFYFTVLFDYPVTWWLCLAALLALGILVLCFYPKRKRMAWRTAASGGLIVAAFVAALLLPKAEFQQDRQIQYAVSDYGRAQSAEAAYITMFNAHRVYEVCGLYQTGIKDVWRNVLYPLTSRYDKAQKSSLAAIDQYFENRETAQDNEMTGIFQGKNVILVLMESMDDWALGEHTPTINRMMEEGINFTNFYTPGYGNVRTFNSEYCANTGSFLSSQGGYAFDYVTNHYSQSLANLLEKEGYSALTYHYNNPDFYSRGVFEPAMGYEAYISYEDYVDDPDDDRLFDDQFLFDNKELSESFFREGPKLNFLITRSAHLSYVYNEVLSYWGLQKYPEYRGMTGNEEEDCMYLKARLVDDMFARLLAELEAHGQLENTVIVAMTDHYTYGIKDQNLVLERSGVTDPLLVERTPCFIWSADGPSMEITKTLNTSDLLPTVLNLLGVDSPYPYMGQDAFNGSYPGYAFFPDGSWITNEYAYSAKEGVLLPLNGAEDTIPVYFDEMTEKALEFVHINNLILDTDYYGAK